MWTTSAQLSTAGEGTPRPVFSGLSLVSHLDMFATTMWKRVGEASTTTALKTELTLANHIQRKN